MSSSKTVVTGTREKDTCKMVTLPLLLIISIVFNLVQSSYSVIDSRSYLIKITTTIMIENDGNTPLTHHLIDCDERNGHSRLSHIIAKLSNLTMPVTKTDDGKMWRIDLSSKPIEPGVQTPLTVTKVFTHLELVPSHDVYLMPYSSIQYQVRIIKQGRAQKIKVPSEQYYFVVENRDLVDLEESTSTALALETEGSTKVRFVDKSVISDEDFIQPESTIHIVKPSYLSMRVTPGNSWALQKFTDYIIEISIFDEHQHQIYPSDNLDIQLTAGNEIVMTNSTTNGTFHTIHTVNSGPSRLVARLMGTTPSLYSFERPIPEIDLAQELEIFDPLDIKPTAIVLPWLPETRPSYQVSIFVGGGTGSYRWFSNNSALTEITYNEEDSSVAKITTVGEGAALVQCTDIKSPVFLKHSLVVVSKIAEMRVLPSITETELGGDIFLPVAVYGNLTSLLELHLPEDELDSDLVLFHDCSKIIFDIEIVEKSRFSYDDSQIYPNTRAKACMSLKFTCLQPGSSRVWISYTDQTDPSSKPIKTTGIIACYKPLQPVHPKEVGILALHTSIELAFEGGPRPFGSRIGDHYAYLEPNNSPILTFKPIIDRYRLNKDLHVFEAYCNNYGEVLITLSVGNQPSTSLPNPLSSKISMKVVCARPDSIQLRPRLKESCPLNDINSLVDTIVPISTTTATEFEVIVFDDAKRPFLNISSFGLRWNLQGQGSSNPRQIEEVNAVAGFRRMLRNYITVKPNGIEGIGRLKIELNQVFDDVKTADLTATLEIQFVDYAQIKPNRTILYNHNKNVVALDINRGSGYFTVDSLQGFANVTYSSSQNRIYIAPMSVGTFIIRLEDLCMESSSSGRVNVVDGSEFSREVLKPGRKLRYCQEMEAMFCLYLAVEHVQTTRLTATTTTTTPAPSPTRAPTTTAAPVKARITEITTTSPRVAETVEPKQESSSMQRVVGWLLALVVTASVVVLGCMWWKEKKPANPQFVRTNVSFSPCGSSGSSGSNTSRGPVSSTPKNARPLYTEKFSTTLLSD